VTDTAWKQRHADKLASADAAVSLIRRGRRILIGSGAAEPVTLVEALVRNHQRFADNEILHLLTLGAAPYVEPGLEAEFRHIAFFIGENVRAAVQQGRADFMPVFLSEIPELIRSRRVKLDVALIQVSPPDRHGCVSLGVSVDVVRAAVESAELVLAEVNPNMPRTYGDSFLHVDQIARLVEVDYPLPERIFDAPDAISRQIGEHIAALIPDGATLQMGIGNVPNAVLGQLRDRNDLGIHTEMFSDGVMELVQSGVINGRKKTLLPGKLVTSFVMGSRRLYDWVHDNPLVEMRPSSFTNDPFTIARNDNMVAINSALAVDLTGQVAADTLMGRFFSGIGGQVDFIRGAARSRGGRPIIALPSTAKDGTVSRIQPVLEEGAGVVTSRGDVHYVVTEYGAADLWGKTVRERAMALIEIAHPDHRIDLLDAAKHRRYVFANQLAPRGLWPGGESAAFTLPGGEQVVVRPMRMSDAEPLQDMFYRLSDESVYRRFLAHKHSHPNEEIIKLCDLDYQSNMALLACPAADDREIVAMARYDVDPRTRLADIAFLVRDDWQGKGLGTLLMQRMTEIARDRGLAGFTADVLTGNKPMLGIFQRSGLPVHGEHHDGLYRLTARFPG